MKSHASSGNAWPPAWTATVVVANLLVLLSVATPASASDTEPGNDTCQTPDAVLGGYQYGTLSSADRLDYYGFPSGGQGIVTNMGLYAEMNPGYPPLAGKDYDLYVGIYDAFGPTYCPYTHSSTGMGTSMEFINGHVGASRAHWLTVMHIGGSGTYDFRGSIYEDDAVQGMDANDAPVCSMMVGQGTFTGSIHDGYAPGHDSADCFTFDPPDLTNVAVTMTSNWCDAGGPSTNGDAFDLDLQMLRSDGFGLIDSSQGGTCSSEFVECSSALGLPVKIRVHRWAGDPDPGGYTVRIEQRPFQTLNVNGCEVQQL